MMQTGTELIIAAGGTYIQFERDKSVKLAELSARLSSQGKEIVNIVEEDVKRPLTGWLQTIRVVWRTVPATPTQVVQEAPAASAEKPTIEKVAVTSDNFNSILDRIDLFLEDKEWDKAVAYCESALDYAPKSAEVYLKYLLADLKFSSFEKLLDSDTKYEKNTYYQKALRFGDEEFTTRLNDAISRNKEQKEKARLSSSYKNAVSAMESASTEDNYKSAAKQFNSIIDYKDSKELAEKCLGKAEKVRRESTYKEASELMSSATSVGDVRKAIKLFNSVLDYSDSAEQIDICNQKIEEIKAEQEASRAEMAAKKEAERVEAERKAEEQRIEKERKSKRNKRIGVIVISIIAICAALALTVICVIIPLIKYNKAVELLESGNYETAIASFEEMGEYRDADERIKECWYKQGEELFNNGRYKEASEIFNKLLDYSDSKDKYNESIYQLALPFYEAGDLDNSNPLFEKIKDYKDSAQKIHYHDWVKVSGNDATCINDGVYNYKCSSCGETKSEKINALGHDWQDATCTEAKRCRRCGEVSGKALGHTDTNVCTRCGKVLFGTITYSGNALGVVNSDGIVKKGINLPAGKYKITFSMESLMWFYLYDSNGNQIVNTGNSYGSKTLYFEGPISGGYIKSVQAGQWKVIIEPDDRT